MNDCVHPKGLLEEPLLLRLLHSFLDKLQNPRSRLSIKISQKNTPELFLFDQYDITYLWMLIQSLETDYKVISIKMPSRQSADKECYDGATLTFNRHKEMLVREWLQRPDVPTGIVRWYHALADCRDYLTDEQIIILKDNRIKHETKTEKEIVDALCRVGQALNQTNSPLSCRTLSARYFDGDSKFLDQREGLLRQLFADISHQIKSRPILLSVAIPRNIDSILFIENQESFLECVAQNIHPKLEKTALVYSAGFRGTSERIRSKEGVAFTHMMETAPAAKTAFEQWWYGKEETWPCYFWGDLDYDGMRILATLRNTFPQLEAWRPGYEAMLAYHQKGVGHAPHEAKKESQRPISITGCQYADEILLPLVRSSQLFLDQEVISILED